MYEAILILIMTCGNPSQFYGFDEEGYFESPYFFSVTEIPKPLVLRANKIFKGHIDKETKPNYPILKLHDDTECTSA